jgi:hypothetical protein
MAIPGMGKENHMSLNIAEQLVSGIENIERMRKEIKIVLTTLCNMLTYHLNRWADNPGAEVFPATNGEWMLTTVHGTESWVIMHNGFTVFAGKGSCYMDAHYATVAVIHSDLPSLVTGLMKKFPVASRALDPFLEAATVRA